MEKFTHFILLRPDSDLAPILKHRAWQMTGSSDRLIPVLACHCLSIEGLLVQATVRWIEAASAPATQKLGIPLSEILLMIDVQGSDERTIGFLREV